MKNIYTWTVPSSAVGPTPLKVLMLGLPGIGARKTATQAPYLALPRNVDPLLCAVGAIALSLFSRWRVRHSIFPNFQRRRDWMGFVLQENMRASCVEALSEEVSSSATRAQMKEQLKAAGVDSRPRCVPPHFPPPP